MENNFNTIKFRLWDGTRPVVLNGTADRYTETCSVKLGIYINNLEKFGFGKHSIQNAAKRLVEKELYGAFNGECPYTVEIISIEPLETYPVKQKN